MSDSREVMDTRNDPYAQYGAKVGTTGQYLSFKAGEYLFGQDAEELPIGSRLVANMPGLRIGWRKWFGGTVTDDLTELLSEGPTVQQRDILGSLDKSQWEKDDRGEPRDPWQLTNILELSDGEQTYIFSTGSKGGINAIGRLCRDYGRERRQRPDMLPIIELQRDSYMHPQYKKVYTPDFKIVGWTDESNPSLEDANRLDTDRDTARLPDNYQLERGLRAANPTEAAVVAAAPTDARTSTTTRKSPSNPTRF